MGRWQKRLFVLSLLLTLPLLGACVRAQNEEAKKESKAIDEALRQAEAAEAELRTAEIGNIHNIDIAAMPKEVKDTYYAFCKASFEHQKWLIEHQRTVLGWQHLSTILLFVTAISIVISGMYMSWLQFYTLYIHVKTTPKASEKPTPKAMDKAIDKANQSLTDDPGETPLESRLTADVESSEAIPVNKANLSLSGVEISTPIVGVLILALSLAFFYLYLSLVYPVHFLGAK